MVVVHIPTTGTSVWHLYPSCCRDTPEPSQYSYIITHYIRYGGCSHTYYRDKCMAFISQLLQRYAWTITVFFYNIPICHSCLAILSPNFTSPKYWMSSVYYLTICLKYCQMQTPRCLVWVYIHSFSSLSASRKHAYIILTPLNPTFI